MPCKSVFATVCLRTAVTKGLVGGGRNRDGLQNDRGRSLEGVQRTPRPASRPPANRAVSYHGQLFGRPVGITATASAESAQPMLPENLRREAITYRSLVSGQRCEQCGADCGGAAGGP